MTYCAFAHSKAWTEHWYHMNIISPFWAPSQYRKRRLSVRSRKVSKPRGLYLELSDRSEIWQALRQQCCRCACQISKRYDNLKYQSRGFETLRDLTERRLFGYWDRCWDRDIEGYLGQYWGCCRLGSLCHHVVRSHGTDHVGQMEPCCPWYLARE